ncbi:copper resistance CopC family protein [Microbacterium flavum]|uniref:Copper resistance protein CopC n=1 Tax=Microbacterium flavum TaxID=415216 RepID=A0ABS5XR72_9MICO|nr:copper resistance CopC family protein [Microbacterium flavum]MBT8797030.1 copper resistance protein CopC [Microbacterium flavum]
MSQEIHTARRPLALLFGLVAALALVLAAAPAWAHDELIGSDPAAGSEIDALPSELTLTFSGVLMDEPGATEVVVTDATGASLVGGDPVLDGTRLTQPLTGSASGAVTVIWRVVSSDGHPVSDQFTFTVGDGSAVLPAPAPTATAPADSAPASLAGVWIIIALVAVALGGALVAVLVARARRSRED